MVSEHADFCPQCGCRIAYILNYYEKAGRKTSAKKKFGPIWDSLPAEAKKFLESVQRFLEETKTLFFFDKRTDFVGFRKAKGEKLLVYFSRHADGSLVIHLFSFAKQINETFPFDSSKVGDYLTTVKEAFSARQAPPSIPERAEADTFASSTRDELQSICKYTVFEGKILPIRVTEVAANNGKYRVWFTLPDGAKRFCLLTNVENILFDSEESARTHLNQDNLAQDGAAPRLESVVASSKNVADEYVLYSNGQYVIGFHETKHFDSVMSGYSFQKKSSSFVVVKVPDFSGDVIRAIVIYGKAAAEQYAHELSQQTGLPIEARLRSDCCS